MTISLPTPLKTTADTVTLSRSAWEALVEAIEDAEDLAAVRAAQAEREALGEAEFRRLCYTEAELDRILAGVSPLAIWRDRAGLTQAALAQRAGLSRSYVALIEAGRKPGSVARLRQLASALNVPVAHLIGDASPED